MFSLSAICFLVSLAMLIPTQILYTNNTIHHQLTNHPKWGWNPQSILWGGVGVLAWLTLISELVGWILIGEAITLSEDKDYLLYNCVRISCCADPLYHW
jgi:hypothetical protein